MYLQPYMHDCTLLPIGSISVADCHVYPEDIINWDSLAQWQFNLYKLRSQSANLPGYTKLLNQTAYSHGKIFPVVWLHGSYLHKATPDTFNHDKTHASSIY